MKSFFKARTMVLVIFCLIGHQLISQDIYTAVAAGDVEKTREYINEDPELLNQRNADLLTPLNLAASENQLEVAELLLELGADPSIGDRENSQPIHLAAVSGSIPVIDLLLDAGVDVNTTDINHMTPLLFACSRGQKEAVKHLMGKKADLKAQTVNGFSALHLAAFSGDVEIIKLLVDKGAKVRCSTPDGFTPLHGAVAYGRTDAVKYLLDKGADIHAQTAEGRQPLAYGLGPNSYDAVVYLIEKGADVNHMDKTGFTALHDAVGRGNLAITKLLVENRANINAATDNGLVPLAMAAYTDNSTELGRYLVLSGADINPDPCKENKSCTCGPNFRTPLHAACQMGKTELVNILVDNGARINVFSNDGLTPLHYAVAKGDIEAVEYLVRHGAFLNVKDTRGGMTELHMAAVRGYGDIANFLIDNGSCYRMKDNQGETPVDLALSHGQKQIGYGMYAAGADDSWLKSYINKECPVSRVIGDGEATAWFLGHSGWAVKTKDHLLVFDYFDSQQDRKPDHVCLASGCIDPAELKNLNVTVFSTHEHADHFNASCFNWKEQMPDVNFVFCFQPEGVTEDYRYTPVHEETALDDMNIYVIQSTDLGGGYLVEVDGLVIFHMGDHANGEDVLSSNFMREIDMVAAKKKKVDILFSPIRGCGLGTPEQVREGTYYAIKKLQPALFVPMHSGNFSYEYQAFVEQAKKDGLEQNMKYATGKGDMVHYNRETVVD